MKITHVILMSAVLATALSASESTDETKVLKLDSFVVTDRQDSAYKGATAITGTKTDTPLLNIPQNIQIITKDLIDDMGAVDITDLYPLMGSVTEFSYGGVSMRGFRQEQTRYNGIAGDPQNAFGIVSLENVEHVEVLKGPVGLLYGDNEAGGMINIVTAKPKAVFGGNVSARVGSWGLVGGNAQVTGPIDARKRFLYLAAVNYFERDSFRANYHQESLNLNLALTWIVTSATRLNAQVERIENDIDGARIRGVPFGPNGFLGSISFNGAEPTDYQNLSTTVYSANLDHVFSENFRLNSYVRYFSSFAPQAYHETNTFIPATGVWPREFRRQEREVEVLAWAVNGVGNLDFLGAKHKVLAGAEYTKTDRIFASRTATQAVVRSINVYNPVYGLSSGSMYDTSLASVVPTDTDAIRLGYYLQDQISVQDKWHLLAGARYEFFEDERFRPTTDQFEDSVLTYRAGAVYMIQPTTAVFLSYAMGLVPQTLGSEDQNGPFPPQESVSWEGGLKLDLLQKRLGITTSVYEIVKTNILERDPTPGAPSNWRVPIGEVTSRGFEFDLNGQITTNWSLSANYAYNDAKVTDAGQFGSAIGSRFPNAPRHKAGMWSRYNLPQYRLGFGLGVSYVGERENFTGVDNYPGPAYTVYNASVFYRWKKMQFNLKVENLFDKVYAKSVFTNDGSFPGNPRNFTFTVTHRF